MNRHWNVYTYTVSLFCHLNQVIHNKCNASSCLVLMHHGKKTPTLSLLQTVRFHVDKNSVKEFMWPICIRLQSQLELTIKTCSTYLSMQECAITCAYYCMSPDFDRLCGLVVRLFDSWLGGYGFESRLGHTN